MNVMSNRQQEDAVNKMVQNPIKMSGKDVSVFYGEKQALFDVNLEIPERQVMALIGPSGCGKSTFLRCLNRMNDTIDICQVHGDISLDGEDIYHKDNFVSILTSI